MALLKLRKVQRVLLTEAERVDNDPRFPEHFLFATGITYEGLPPCLTQNTWYVVRKVGHRPIQMLSLCLDSIKRGWDHCGKCARWFTLCTCPVLTPPAHIKQAMGLVDTPVPAQVERTLTASVAEVQAERTKLRKVTAT